MSEKILESYFPSNLKNLLPSNLKKAIVFNDSLSDSVLYCFGKPPTTRTGMKFQSFGSGNNFCTKNLILAIGLADKYLGEPERDRWLKKIDDSNHHQSHVFEMRPLLDLSTNYNKINFEVENYSPGNLNIDWEIEFEGYTILVEVKNRTVTEVNHLEDLIKLTRELNQGVSVKNRTPIDPPSNAKELFKSVEAKFKVPRDVRQIQGVWIGSAIRESKKLLEDYFNETVLPDVQFVIFAGWESNEAYILVRDESYKEVLISCFGLVESRSFVF